MEFRGDPASDGPLWGLRAVVRNDCSEAIVVLTQPIEVRTRFKGEGSLPSEYSISAPYAILYILGESEKPHDQDDGRHSTFRVLGLPHYFTVEAKTTATVPVRAVQALPVLEPGVYDLVLMTYVAPAGMSLVRRDPFDFEQSVERHSTLNANQARARLRPEARPLPCTVGRVTVGTPLEQATKRKVRGE
jgi:hypothetical protein